jgi:hypothetical protein
MLLKKYGGGGLGSKTYNIRNITEVEARSRYRKTQPPPRLKGWEVVEAVGIIS